MEILHLIKADQVEALLARHLLTHAFPRANLRVYRGRSDHTYIFTPRRDANGYERGCCPRGQELEGRAIGFVLGTIGLEKHFMTQSKPSKFITVAQEARVRLLCT